MVVEVPDGDSLSDFGAGKAVGIILGVFFGVLGFTYLCFVPYFHRRLVEEDTRIRVWHLPLGPLLWREDPPLYFPSKGTNFVKDYSGGAKLVHSPKDISASPSPQDNRMISSKGNGVSTPNNQKDVCDESSLGPPALMEPRERFLGPTDGNPIYHPARAFAWVRYIFPRGVAKDCVTFEAEDLHSIHSHAAIYDNKVEHLLDVRPSRICHDDVRRSWSNDVANAVAPWVAAYDTYVTGKVTSKADTPIWILVRAGFLLGTGFWFFGYHIIRALGNRITRVSPT
jgi:hypothetical protein